MRQYSYKLLALSFISASVFAAKPINLQNKPVEFLQNFAGGESAMKQTSSDADFNQTTHIRLQQTYAGYSVWGGEAIVHVLRGENSLLTNVISAKHSHATLNGIMFQNLEADLRGAPKYIFGEGQANKALQQAIQYYQKQTGIKNDIKDPQSKLIVFVDKKNRAHWGFLASFLVEPMQAMPAKPTYIIDAMTFTVDTHWDNIQSLENVDGGGFGGNKKMGKLAYDNLAGDYPKLAMQRDSNSKICYLKNAEVTVQDARHKKEAAVQFLCNQLSSEHNGIYWDAAADAVNGAYSPSNDALYVGRNVKAMYQKWYGIPVLTANGNPMMLNMVVHANMENAYWDGQQMVFGDGETFFYPLVSLGVGAHEISHGFTQQHSNLVYVGQSGGLNESFSDMAAEAAEFYSVGHNNWQIGSEIMKSKDGALRYMDEPTKDCPAGHHPGDYCSISQMKDYNNALDVHFSSGIFNKVFYLIGTSAGWDTKKAFDIMVQANSHYWTRTTTFANAACGVLMAAKDFKYDTDVVAKSMAAVGIDTSKCAAN